MTKLLYKIFNALTRYSDPRAVFSHGGRAHQNVDYNNIMAVFRLTAADDLEAHHIPPIRYESFLQPMWIRVSILAGSFANSLGERLYRNNTTFPHVHSTKIKTACIDIVNQMVAETDMHDVSDLTYWNSVRRKRLDHLRKTLPKEYRTLITNSPPPSPPKKQSPPTHRTTVKLENGQYVMNTEKIGDIV